MTQEAASPLVQKPATLPDLLVMVMAGILSLLLWLGVGWQLVVFAPRCDRLFGEFHMRIPFITQWVIHDARWAVPAVTIATLVICIAIGKRSPWPWLFLILLLPLAINVLVGASLYFPYMELLASLEGGGKK